MIRRAWFLCLLSGCASSTGVGHARLLAEDEYALTFGLDLGVSFSRLTPGQDTPAPWPQGILGARYGLGKVELGARTWGWGIPTYFYTFGAAIDGKLALFQSPSIEEGFDLALGLDVGYHQINYQQAPIHLLVVQAPLAFGWNLGGGDQLLLGIRLADHLMGGADQTLVNMLFGGFSIGYSWRALPGVDIRPELVVLYSPVSFNGYAEDEERRGLSIVQLGLGSAFSL